MPLAPLIQLFIERVSSNLQGVKLIRSSINGTVGGNLEHARAYISFAAVLKDARHSSIVILGHSESFQARSSENARRRYRYVASYST